MDDDHQNAPQPCRCEHPDLAEVRRKIAIGIEQLDRGEGFDGEKVFEELLDELGAGSGEK